MLVHCAYYFSDLSVNAFDTCLPKALKWSFVESYLPYFDRNERLYKQIKTNLAVATIIIVAMLPEPLLLLLLFLQFYYSIAYIQQNQLIFRITYNDKNEANNKCNLYDFTAMKRLM